MQKHISMKVDYNLDNKSFNCSVPCHCYCKVSMQKHISMKVDYNFDNSLPCHCYCKASI